MVYTFAVAALLPDFCNIRNLRAVVDALPEAVARAGQHEYPALEIAAGELSRSPTNTYLPPQLAQALIAASGTVVWGDPDSFDDIVIALWSATWPSVRKTLSFRLSFDPNDLDADFPPTLVTTPKQVGSRWPRNRLIARTSDSQLPANDAATAVLLGEANGMPLSQLQEELEADLTTLRQLKVLEALAAARAQNAPTFSALRSQLQLMAKLSPESSKGHLLKSSLLDEISKELPRQSVAAEIRGLRNIPWESFDPGKTAKVLQIAADWTRSNIVPNTVGRDAVAPLLIDALSESTVWASSLRAGLQEALDRDSDGTPSAIWMWLGAGLRPYLEGIVGMYVKNSERENAFADSCPKLSDDPELATDLILLSSRRRWFELHAVVLMRSRKPEQALTDHLAALGEHGTAGLQRIRKGIGAREFFVLGMKLRDGRLIDAAVRCLSDLPELWNHFDSRDRFWRTLFRRALEAEGRTSLEGGIGRFVAANVIAALDVPVWEDEQFVKDVIDLYPDWSDLGAPDDTWARIPASCRSRAVGATADGWLRRFLAGEAVAIPTSSELRLHVAAELRVRAALEGTQNVSRSVELFEQLSELSEQLFTWWAGSVLRSAPRISDMTSLRIGELLASREWRRGADEVCRTAEHRQDLRPAITACISLLSMLRRVQLFFAGALSGGNQIDLWSAVLELGLDLYPYGPGVNDLWSRAGGHAADLLYFTSGRDSWGTMISEARRGRHNVTLDSLTRAMLDDYPGNLDLKRIARMIRES